MLLHDELDGNVGICVKSLGYFAFGVFGTEEANALASAACAAYFNDYTGVERAIELINGVLL